MHCVETREQGKKHPEVNRPLKMKDVNQGYFRKLEPETRDTTEPYKCNARTALHVAPVLATCLRRPTRLFTAVHRKAGHRHITNGNRAVDLQQVAARSLPPTFLALMVERPRP
jgi:hypothetical protein